MSSYNFKQAFIMTFDLKNRVVLITGGCYGIGAKVIEVLLGENVKHVANLDIAEDVGVAQQNKLNETYGANKLKFYKCDITKEDQLFGSYQSILDEQGHIDIVINNAGIVNDSKEKYKMAIEINFTALITSTLKAIEVMRKDEGGKGGVVINISSAAALYQDELLPIYYGTKSAVLQFSNCIGLPRYNLTSGVRIITLCFGAIDTQRHINENIFGNFFKYIQDDIFDIIQKYPIQSVDLAVSNLIEVIKRGESGSTWLSVGDKPVQDITTVVKKPCSILTDILFE